MTFLASDIQSAFSLEVTSLSRLSGGDIAEVYKVDTTSGPFFAKFMPGTRGQEVLAAEALGLHEISRSNSVGVPKVHGLEAISQGSCLLLEYIPPGHKTPQAMESLGRGLAKMHQSSAGIFGWPKDNFIGSLPQQNTQMDDWTAFYTSQRLLPMYRAAVDLGRLAPSEAPSLERMEQRIRNEMPHVVPGLLHGDLWGGNYLISDGGIPFLIDPAAYYGHAEVDLAMSRLFGGFSETFYGAYREILPDVPGWERRTELYQLYYLLVHLILFGASYAPAVRQHGRDWFGV